MNPSTAALRELGRDLPRLLSPGGLRGAAVEAGWWSLHLATYPWGLLGDAASAPGGDRYHLRDLTPAERGLLVRHVEAARTPILLVHGILDNRAIFAMLRRRLRRRGLGSVCSLNYSPLTNDVRQAARELGEVVETLVRRTGYERVHVVAHSLGGLIARYYVQRLGGDERVHTLVTLGTPHSGTLHAHLLPVQLCRQLRPGSELFTELQLPAPDCRTRLVAYWSDGDQVIVPHRSGRLDHPDLPARNVRVRHAGHLSLPRDGRVAHEIADLLSRPASARDTAPDAEALRSDTTA
jgi:triacylglycerol lipase